MIEITFNNNTSQLVNYSSTPFRGDYFFIDLNSNLTFSRGWATLDPGQYVDIDMGSSFMWDKIQELGFNVKLVNNLDTPTLVADHNIYFTDNKPQYHFSSPYEHPNFGPWLSIMYENEYSGLFEINENDVVYDLGANIGVFSKWVDITYPYKQIYGFEPTSGYLDHLNITFKDKNRITFFDKAISKENKIGYFNVFKDSQCNTLVDNNFNDNFLGKTEVECINLEDFVRQNSLLPPTFIKMDIEGAEYESIEGLSDEFIQGIRVLLLEFHNGKQDKLFSFIKRMIELGFWFDVKKDNSLLYHMGTVIFYNKKQI